MSERAGLFVNAQATIDTFSQNLRPIGPEQHYLVPEQLSVSMHFGKEEGSAKDSLRVTISYYGHPGYTARFVDHGEDLELVEMREVFGGRRGKSIHVGVKSPELIRDVVLPLLTQADAPWQRLTMGKVFTIVGVSEMRSGQQQRMLNYLPAIFNMQPVGEHFVRTLR